METIEEDSIISEKIQELNPNEKVVHHLKW